MQTPEAPGREFNTGLTKISSCYRNSNKTTSTTMQRPSRVKNLYNYRWRKLKGSYIHFIFAGLNTSNTDFSLFKVLILSN